MGLRGIWGQPQFTMALRGLQDRQNDLDRFPAPAGVVETAPTLADRGPERVERISLPRPARAARDSNLPRPVKAVNQNAVR